MSISSSFCDAFSKLKNAQMAKHLYVDVAFSRLIYSCIELLKEEGYIDDMMVYEARKGVRYIRVNLKYYRNAPVITHFKLVSKPGCRVYSSVKTLKKVMNGLGVQIISTSPGLKTDKEARALGIGGELLMEIG
jgi:small subunit ribosomal protein S8